MSIFQMSRNVRYVLILTLACQCHCFCGEADDPTKVAKVTVSNSTHLRVSWNGLFTGCTSQDVGFLIMLAVAEQSSNSYDLSDSSETFSAEFERREALVALDPCLSYQIYIRIFSNGGGSFRESKIIKYNDMSQQAHF